MRKKASKKAVSSQDSKDNKQILHKVFWSKNNWGGKIGKSKPFDEGNLLRPAMLDEIVPEREDYFIRPNGMGNNYHLLYQGFHRKVNYEDIKSFVKHKMVWVYKEFNVHGK